MDEHRLTWLQASPKIPLLPDCDKRQPYPLKWEEQNQLLAELLARMAETVLFKLNTGRRDGEQTYVGTGVCRAHGGYLGVHRARHASWS